MSTENSQAVSETVGTNASEDQSGVRRINYSSPEDLAKLDTKKPAAFEAEGNTCANSSKIPRPPLATSSSFNETLKGNQSRGKTKKAPSMIPRSRSRKRNENDKIKLDIPYKSESSKNQFDNSSLSNNKKSNRDLGEQEPRIVLSPDLEGCEENLGRKSTKISSSLKPCQEFVQIAKKVSDTLYKDAQEDIMSGCLDNKINLGKAQEINEGPPRSVTNAEDKEKDEREAARQERTIRNLYETISCMTSPLFDNFKWASSENTTNPHDERPYSDPRGDEVINDFESVRDVSSIQGHYEFTLKEISNIWKNTLSLIDSVRDHAVKFVEHNSKVIDKEQLSLEAEMLQLALDFAISYSKLKTDFLMKLVKKRLNVSALEKSELENFMDSKTFAALYNNDDLAAMARTVQDLNTSLLKGEDLEQE